MNSINIEFLYIMNYLVVPIIIKHIWRIDGGCATLNKVQVHPKFLQ